MGEEPDACLDRYYTCYYYRKTINKNSKTRVAFIPTVTEPLTASPNTGRVNLTGSVLSFTANGFISLFSLVTMHLLTQVWALIPTPMNTGGHLRSFGGQRPPNGVLGGYLSWSLENEAKLPSGALICPPSQHEAPRTQTEAHYLL